MKLIRLYRAPKLNYSNKMSKFILTILIAIYVALLSSCGCPATPKNYLANINIISYLDYDLFTKIRIFYDDSETEGYHYKDIQVLSNQENEYNVTSRTYSVDSHSDCGNTSGYKDGHQPETEFLSSDIDSILVCHSYSVENGRKYFLFNSNETCPNDTNQVLEGWIENVSV